MPRRMILLPLLLAGLLWPGLAPLLALAQPAGCPMPCCARRAGAAACCRRAMNGARWAPSAPCARVAPPAQAASVAGMAPPRMAARALPWSPRPAAEAVVRTGHRRIGPAEPWAQRPPPVSFSRA